MARTVRVRVTAGAKKEHIETTKNGVFSISVKEPKERNCANRRAQELLARHFYIPTKHVRLVAGHRSSTKRFEIKADNS